MGPAVLLPRLVFGAGALERLSDELSLLGMRRALLISDRGLERAGILEAVQQAADFTPPFLDVPENPTAAGADQALAAYREGGCDGIVALGGGSVLDTAKLVAALAANPPHAAADMIGRPNLIVNGTVPSIAIPTTVGTGSECSPVSALHPTPSEAAVGTRHPALVPRVALCDPDLARTLPRRLTAATGIDALSHCIEGFFAEPANPIIDALALDGAARVFADILAALKPEGNAARASLMAAAFAGGAAIHKGLGPAHAVALACGDQDVHHGTVIGAVLPRTTRLLALHLPEKAERLRRALCLPPDSDLGDALERLVGALELPTSLTAAGYRLNDRKALLAAVIASPFNKTTPYVPTESEYEYILKAALS